MKTQKIILIVEDERSLREAVRDVLVLKNFLVLEAKNGKEGLEIALSKHPDLILLDQIMPEMDGMSALKKIREDKWGATVPVILLTNLSGTSEQIVEGVIAYSPAENLIKSDWKIHDIVKKIENIFKNKTMIKQTALKLKILAREKDLVRRKLAVTAKKLSLKAKQLAVIAKEKEVVRRKLVVTANKLKSVHEMLERKVQERTKDIERAKAKDEAILASIGDGMVVVNKEGKVTYVNQAFEKMVGWKMREVLGKYIVEVVPREDEKGDVVFFNERILTKVLSGEKVIADLTKPFYYIRKDKTRFPASSIVTPIVLENKIIGIVETFRDITKEKGIDKAKTEFISLASHQLRTPLTTISWYTEMLLSNDVGKVSAEQRQYLGEIYQGTRRMVDLVNTLLDVSRLELGTFVAEPKMTDIILLAHSVLNEQKSDIDKKKLLIIHRFSKKASKFSIDPKLYRIIFQNLLSNAVKYTPVNGKIEFSISFDDRKNISIKMSDTGYGIPKNQQDKIFTKLFRADNVRDKDTDGTGLGLYIVKSIVENSGGKVWFHSEASKASDNPGTTFYVNMPITAIRSLV